ncbi:MAG: hypothetical protein GY750_20710 [Lentisphaerae bacterium]|nr:hypothetical protein [Lentisphaerota bacterium]MCP4103813.1 hypothetical protein [Lentisphaerota bacterium]
MQSGKSNDEINLHSAWEELLSADKVKFHLKKRKLFLALEWIFIKLLEQNNAKPQSLKKYQKEIVETVKKFIQKNFSQNPDLNRLSKIAA